MKVNEMRTRAEREKDKILVNYTCYFCQHKFEQKVGKYGAHIPGKANNCVSSQVRCPVCKNFIKTWQEE
jgi:rubredoxin